MQKTAVSHLRAAVFLYNLIAELLLEQLQAVDNLFAVDFEVVQGFFGGNHIFAYASRGGFFCVAMHFDMGLFKLFEHTVVGKFLASIAIVPLSEYTGLMIFNSGDIDKFETEQHIVYSPASNQVVGYIKVQEVGGFEMAFVGYKSQSYAADRIAEIKYTLPRLTASV